MVHIHVCKQKKTSHINKINASLFKFSSSCKLGGALSKLGKYLFLCPDQGVVSDRTSLLP